MTEPRAKPKKNLWLTIGLSLVAAWLVWQRLSPASRPDVANATQAGRVVALFGEASPGLAEELSSELGIPVRDHTRPGDTTGTALARSGDELALKPNYLILRLGLADLAQQTPLEETLRSLEAIVTKAKAQGALVAYVAEPPPPGVGDNWLMAIRDLCRQHGVLWIARDGAQRAATAAARALRPFL